jgi:type 1 fimbria pilin
MKRRITIWAVCLVVLLAWTGLAFAQTAKPAAMKTVKLPSGEEVFDISGEWDVVVEHYDSWAHFGTYPQLFKITQEGTSFKGIRLKDSPPPTTGKAGDRSMQGEVDKNGVKKIEVISARGSILPSNCKISENGNKMNIDVPQKIRLTLIRK